MPAACLNDYYAQLEAKEADALHCSNCGWGDHETDDCSTCPECGCFSCRCVDEGVEADNFDPEDAYLDSMYESQYELPDFGED